MAMIGHGQPINQATGFATNTPTTFRAIIFPCDSASFALAGIDAALTDQHILRNVQQTGSYVVSGVAASFVHGRIVAAASASYTWTIADLVTRDMGLSLNTGSYALSGVAATLDPSSRVIAAGSKSFSLTASNVPVKLAYGRALAATKGTLALNGVAASFRRTYAVAANVNPSGYFLNGVAATLRLQNVTITCASTAYVIIGAPAETNISLGINPGAFTFTGINAILTKGGASLACAKGALTWTIADVITRDTGLAINTGSYTESGLPAQLLFHAYRMTAGIGTFAISGSDSHRDLSLGITAGSYVLTPTTTAIVRSGNFALSLATGSYALSGVTDAMVRGRNISAVPGSYTETGLAIVPRAAHRTVPAIGTYSLVGIAASLRNTRKIIAVPGAYTETSVAMTPLVAHKIAASIGAYAITGVTANLVRARTLTAISGSYTESGIAASFHYLHKIIPVVGSYTISGAAVAFQTDTAFSLSPTSPGSIAIAGIAPVLRNARIMVASSGSFALNGLSTGTTSAHSLAMVAGAYTLSSIAASLRADHRHAPATGAYSLAGIAASALRRLSAQPNAYALSGVDASLTATHLPQVAASSSYGIAGTDVAFTYRRGLPAIFGLFTLRGVTASSIHIVPPNMGATVSPDTGQDIIGTVTDPTIIGRPSDQLVA